jgi:nitrogen fixation protein FixH
MTHASHLRSRPGWWYPYIYVGAFGVVLAVNLIFMASAVRTFSGLETEQAYDKGLDYNRVLAMAKEQEKLGWTVKADVLPKGLSMTGGHDADIVLTFLDKDGRGVSGLAAMADFIRPTSRGHDRSVPLAEQGGGRYVVAASLPLGGQWQMHVTARLGDLDYQYDQRLYLP